MESCFPNVHYPAITRHHNEWEGTAKYRGTHINQHAGSGTSSGLCWRASLTIFLELVKCNFVFLTHLKNLGTLWVRVEGQGCILWWEGFKCHHHRIPCESFFFFFFSKRSEVGELAIRRPDAQATCWPGRQIATMGSYGRHAQGSKAAALLLRMEL